MTDAAAMVVLGRARPKPGSRATHLLGEYDHHKELFVTESDDAAVYFAHTNNLMTRKAVFERVGPFDERMRGGDMVFVRRVLDLCGTGSVRYCPEALVDHLEVDSARMYFKKAFLYGRSARQYARLSRTRPLRNCERREILERTVHATALSAIETAYLLVLLALGVGVFSLGWFTGGAPALVASGSALET